MGLFNPQNTYLKKKIGRAGQVVHVYDPRLGRKTQRFPGAHLSVTVAYLASSGRVQPCHKNRRAV